MSSGWELEYVVRSQGIPQGCSIDGKCDRGRKEGGCSQRTQQGHTKVFPRWRLRHRPQGWVKTQNGTAAKMGDSRGEDGRERPGQAKGWKDEWKGKSSAFSEE